LAASYLAGLGVNVQINGRGEAIGTVANVREVLEKHPRFATHFWHDTFHQEMLTTWDCDEPRRWTDVDRLHIADVLQGEMGLISFTPELVEQSVLIIAKKNQRDELADWLRSLRWDAVPRLDAWLSDAAGVPQDEYHTALARNFIISMVARGTRPGCKVDTMPVFEGSQGKGKSTLLSVLGGKFYAELTESLDTKDFMVSIQGRWLVEIAELDAFKKSEVTRIKQVLSSQVDRFRPPYGRHAIDAPRRTVFAGTTNESHYLRDATGARRFWPLIVGHIDLTWLKLNREQLFAEAVERLNDGESWWEMPEEAHHEHAEARREDDSWEPAIADYCIGRSEVSISEVLEGAIRVELAKQGKSEQMRASRILATLGYERRLMRRAGKPVRAWVKGNPAPDGPF
jgi:predicted P-loop ATPase